jgi:hypothetical protein
MVPNLKLDSECVVSVASVARYALVQLKDDLCFV